LTYPPDQTSQGKRPVDGGVWDWLAGNIILLTPNFERTNNETCLQTQTNFFLVGSILENGQMSAQILAKQADSAYLSKGMMFLFSC